MSNSSQGASASIGEWLQILSSAMHSSEPFMESWPIRYIIFALLSDQ